MPAELANRKFTFCINEHDVGSIAWTEGHRRQANPLLRRSGLFWSALSWYSECVKWIPVGIPSALPVCPIRSWCHLPSPWESWTDIPSIVRPPAGRKPCFTPAGHWGHRQYSSLLLLHRKYTILSRTSAAHTKTGFRYRYRFFLLVPHGYACRFLQTCHR